MELEGCVCPVPLLRDKAGPEPEDENKPMISLVLEVAHIVPFALGDATVREGWVEVQEMERRIELVLQNPIQTRLQDINRAENGVLLGMNVRTAVGGLAWGIETGVENGACCP